MSNKEKAEYKQSCVPMISHGQFFATPWTSVCKVPLSMAFFQVKLLE